MKRIGRVEVASSCRKRQMAIESRVLGSNTKGMGEN